MIETVRAKGYEAYSIDRSSPYVRAVQAAALVDIGIIDALAPVARRIRFVNVLPHVGFVARLVLEMGAWGIRGVREAYGRRETRHLGWHGLAGFAAATKASPNIGSWLAFAVVLAPVLLAGCLWAESGPGPYVPEVAGVVTARESAGDGLTRYTLANGQTFTLNRLDSIGFYVNILQSLVEIEIDVNTIISHQGIVGQIEIVANF